MLLYEVRYKSNNEAVIWKIGKNKLGLSCAKLIKLEVIVEVVVKVSSQIRGHSVLLQMGGCGGYVVGGWLGKLRI